MAEIKASINFHDAKPNELEVDAAVESSSGVHWAQVAVDGHRLTLFTRSRDDASEVLRKIRDEINVALGDIATPAMQTALQEIADAHLGDQPAAAPGTDYDWACKHIGKLRRIAVDALGVAMAEAA